VIVTDKLASYQVAHREPMPSVPHRRSKYLTNPRPELSPADPAPRAGDETLQVDPARRNDSCPRSAASRRTFGPVGTCCRRPTTDR
jgi:putative transposase